MNLLSSILAYIARQIAALRSADTATNSRIDSTNNAASALTNRVSTAEANIITMNGRLDTAISGVTTDTEVTDIRQGDDGVTYTTAGTAVRTQFSNLKSEANYDKNNLKKSLYDEKYTQIFFGYKWGIFNLNTGVLTTYNVPVTSAVIGNGELIELLSDDVTISIKDGYQVRGVLFNPDKSYNSYFLYLTNGKPTAIQNKKGYYVGLNFAKSDDSDIMADDLKAMDETVFSMTFGIPVFEESNDTTRKLSNITESVNIVNPETFIANGYYLDFNDGVTHIANANYPMTADKIHTGFIESLYAYQTYSDTSTNLLGIYCYAGDTYLGFVFSTLANLVGHPNIAVKEGTTDIRIYSNSGLVKAEHLCVSYADTGGYIAYDAQQVIKKTALPPSSAVEGNYYPLYGKVIANFGDSIFGNKRPPNDVSTSLARITGATVYNLGFGGCRMSQHATGWDAFSMYRLADAIAENDFTYQDSVNVDNVSGMPQYFKETRTLLKSIDFSKVDIITISYGTNDFTAGIGLDNENNLYDTTKFCGALRYSLEKLMEAYPKLHVFVCAPTYRFWIDTENDNEFLYDSDTHEISGRKLTDFVSAVKDVSKDYHVKSIDNYYDLGINKFNRLHWFPANDGTHHNKDGGMLIAQHMANEMF